jgi:DNA (cytosine-5)-methyltransferase 1
LRPSGYPDRERAGEFWNKWRNEIKALGYQIEDRVINAANLGAYTARERLIIVARRDGFKVEWPAEEHGPGKAKPWNAAAEHIDWSIDAPSIFTRERPLSPATMERIRKGVTKFVLNAPQPFIAPDIARVSHGLDEEGKIAAFLAQNHSGLAGRAITDPLSTICAKASGQSLVTISFIDIARQNSTGADLRNPAHTICTSGNHHAEVRVKAFLSASASITGANNPVVRIGGRPHMIMDIGYRFLSTRELWALQGFNLARLKTDIIVNGKPLSETRQKRMIGNSVVPIFMRKIIEANLYRDDLVEYAKAA